MGPEPVPGDCRRELGVVEGEPGGPTVLVVAGIHGNEGAGLAAAERVLVRMQRERPRARGRLTVLVGNIRAVRERTRFIDLDLNRQWTPEKVNRLLDQPSEPHEPAEHAEQRALIAVLRREIAAARGTVFLVDMHTSSAEGPPFLTVGDTLMNRRFARRFPLPLILGLEEQVDGSLLEFLNNYGLITLGIEAGQHAAAHSADRLEAVLWLALVAANFLDPQGVGDLQRHRQLLEDASRGIPRVIEVRRRHAVGPEDGFRMQPGFVNFQSLRKGQLLARDRSGAITCPEDGLMLLPLYQAKGDDGFFVGREVRPFWLRVAATLRRLRLGRLLRLLPGVHSVAGEQGTFRVDTQIARFYPLDTFHLFGFRKRRIDGAQLIVSRRYHDLRLPTRIEFP